jgi:hypothetical protein
MGRAFDNTCPANPADGSLHRIFPDGRRERDPRGTNYLYSVHISLTPGVSIIYDEINLDNAIKSISSRKLKMNATNHVSAVLKENKLGVMPIPRLLVTMSLPLILSMFVQALYNVVDSVFVA